MKLRNIIGMLEQLYPLENKLFDFDNIGLQVGDLDKDVKTVLLTLDMTPEVANEAMDVGADLIIAHHPFIFKGLKSINAHDYFGSTITKMIKNNIGLYIMHTNYDNNKLGMGFSLLDHLGVNNITFIDNTAMVYGDFDSKLTHKQFISLLKHKYQLLSLSFSGNENIDIKKVGIIGGSGFNEQSMLEASNLKLDAYISGDMTYKDALFAKTLNLNVYDVGHYVENIGFKKLVDILKNEIKDIDFIFSRLINPHYIVK